MQVSAGIFGGDPGMASIAARIAACLSSATVTTQLRANRLLDVLG
jgi:hypothetical protein